MTGQQWNILQRDLAPQGFWKHLLDGNQGRVTKILDQLPLDEGEDDEED